MAALDKNEKPLKLRDAVLLAGRVVQIHATGLVSFQAMGAAGVLDFLVKASDLELLAELMPPAIPPETTL